MYKFVALFLVVSAAGFSAAQETSTEVTGSAGITDSRPNSADVPEVYTVRGRFERVMAVRLKHKTDLLNGLTKSVDANKMRNAVILSCIGSATSHHYHAVGNTRFPITNIFVKDTEAPADLVSMNGYVVNGRVHAHVTFARAGKDFGGHLEPGTSVFSFAIVTLGILNEESSLDRVDDKHYR